MTRLKSIERMEKRGRRRGASVDRSIRKNNRSARNSRSTAERSVERACSRTVTLHRAIFLSPATYSHLRSRLHHRGSKVLLLAHRCALLFLFILSVGWLVGRPVGRSVGRSVGGCSPRLLGPFCSWSTGT